jgi:hypothetical protein
MTRFPVARLARDGARPLRNPERHLKALEDWATGFARTYPEPDPCRPHVHWHLPADQRLVDPPTARPGHLRRALQALVEAARLLAEAKPAGRTDEIVYVLLNWPEVFMAEVGVFLDPAYGRDFEKRSHPGQVWTPLPPERSLARDLGLILPPGFVERGYRERSEEEDADGGLRIYESDIWIIREPIEGR